MRMRWMAGAIAIVANVGAAAPTFAAGPVLRSPWDRPVKKEAAAVATPCATPPALPRDITLNSFYSDKAKSIPDPVKYEAYRAAAKPMNDAAHGVADMADAYRERGDAAAAQCAAQWLTSFAKSYAMTGQMSSNQSTYVQGWTIGGFAIDWLKIRGAPGISDEAKNVVPVWLGKVAEFNQAYFDGRSADKIDGRNNHRYWAGVAVMAAGIAANRRDEFGWGLTSLQIGLKQVDADGVLPLEMDRRAKALHYHLFASGPLVVMAELARANGIDAYKENDEALRRLAQRALSGVDDPSFFEQHAGIAQEPVKRSADSLAWAIPFERRYPDPKVHAMLSALPSTSVLYLGGSPPP